MALEDLTGTTKYIDSLVVTNPDGAVDYKSEGDDHIRGIKNTIKNTFPNITGPVTATQGELNKLDGATASTTELNYVTGVTSSIQTQLNAKAAKGANSDITSLSGLTTALSIGQGGSGATTAAGARSNFGLGSLAVKNTVANADIDNDAITQAKVIKTSAYSTQAITASGTWTPSAGIYIISVGGSANLEMYSGSAWVGSGAFTAGVLITDGGNYRLKDNGSGSTAYYRALS